jgi:hypothetical protein
LSVVGALEFGGLPGLGVANALPTLMDQAGVALAAMDGTAHLSMLSPAMEDVTGRSFSMIPAAVIAETFQLHTQDGVRLLNTDELPLVRARAGERVRNLLISTRRPDGSLRFLRCNATPVPATTGDYRGAVCLVEDVTDVATGSSTYQQLRSGMMEWLNHELRTPLSAMRGHLELLTDDAPEPPRTMVRSFAAMQRATDRLMAFADTLSTLGNADALDRASRLDRPGGVNARMWELPWTDHGATASYRTSSYTIYPTGYEEIAHPGRRHWLVRVEDAGDGWAVRWRSRCLNYQRTWEFEPPPESRTAEFLQRCRFSERAAIRRAQQAADELLVDGSTFEEFVAHVRSDAAVQARAVLRGDRPAYASRGDAPALPLA